MDKEFFANVIEEYAEGRPKYTDELISYIKSYSGIDNDSRLLDVGAGPGTAADFFKDYNLDLLEISDVQTDYLKKSIRISRLLIYIIVNLRNTIVKENTTLFIRPWHGTG